MESKHHFCASIIVAVLWGLITGNLFSSPYWVPVGAVAGTLVDVDHVIVSFLVFPRKALRLIASGSFADYYYLITHMDLGYPYWHTLTLLGLAMVVFIHATLMGNMVTLVLIVHWLMDLPGMLFG